MSAAPRRRVILGVDPGTRTTGWGIIAVEGSDLIAVGCDVISPPARWPLEQRLVQIFEGLREIVAKHAPDEMAIEQPFVGENVRSAMAVGEARTAAMLAGATAGLAVHYYPPARVKAYVAGYGQGDKHQVRQMLRLQLDVDDLPEDLNATDALAVALCHAIASQADALRDSGEVTAGGRPGRIRTSQRPG